MLLRRAQRILLAFATALIQGCNATVSGVNIAASTSLESCPALVAPEGVGHSELVHGLTQPCRYDRLLRPGSGEDPLNVSTRAYVYLFQSDSTRTLHFQVHLLLQFRYHDSRLAYSDIAPHVSEIVGESDLQDRIWTPHVYLSNEHTSGVMGTQAKDVLISIYPDGEVIYAFRLKTVLFCWMRLEKFPFDEQKCPLVLESWTYNSSDLLLQWEEDSPVVLNPLLHLSEYTLIHLWTNQSDNAYFNTMQSRGPLYGLYSSLSLTFHLARETGYYMMDYYVPSILLVGISWVSFWLEANALAARINLGTSTMLTFITLSSKTGSQLPKVSYIKSSEIWFLGCTAFIIGSLVEFAFVNTIYRRRRNVELVKADTKNILKSAITPKLARKQLMQQKGSNSILERSSSCPSGMNNSTATLSMQSSSSMLEIPGGVGLEKSALNSSTDTSPNNSIEIPVPIATPSTGTSFTTMTPQEIAQWIDKRSRFWFPLAFIVFNALYWSSIWI